MKSEDQRTDKLTAEVKRLVVKSRNQPVAAAVELCALGDEAVKILCALAQAGGRLRRRLSWFSISTMALGYTINVVFISLIPRGTRELYGYCAMGVVLTGALGIVLARRIGKRATKLLASLDEIRAVGPLLDALALHSFDGDVDGTAQEMIRASLVRLLPHLHASDAASLLPCHITMLNREVDCSPAWRSGASSPREVTYLLVVLKALEQVGDEISVPAVERLRQTTKNPQVREAAEACLPFLQARAAMGKQALLRAASSEGDGLLRAAQGREGEEAAVLLRPADQTTTSEPSQLVRASPSRETERFQ